jgi:hypothetical protein
MEAATAKSACRSVTEFSSAFRSCATSGARIFGLGVWPVRLTPAPSPPTLEVFDVDPSIVTRVVAGAMSVLAYCLRSPTPAEHESAARRGLRAVVADGTLEDLSTHEGAA